MDCQIENRKSQKVLIRFFGAVAIYIGFAGYLYFPHFEYFKRWDFLFLVNTVLGALGCFVLSRRWVGSFVCSFFAGAVYGFGPFMLGFGKFHPTAGFLVASIPWLFCPAVFAARGKWRWMAIPLAMLPFIAIVLFFQASVHVRLFAVSTQARLGIGDLGSVIAPLAIAKRGLADGNMIGFYHVPLAGLIIGLWMLVCSRRIGIMVIFAVGTVLACIGALLQVSPIVWFAMPVLCCSILIGEGMQGLICAGDSDKGPLLTTAALLGLLAIASLLLATKYFQTFAGVGDDYARLLVTGGVMYLLGAVAVTIIFFTAKVGLRAALLRQGILIAAMSIDIFLGARFIVDSVF